MAQVNPIQVQKFLKGIDYPVQKRDLIKQAEANGADDNVRQALQQMPGERFNSPNDVSEALSKLK